MIKININISTKCKIYLILSIQLYCSRSVHKYIKALQVGIYRVIPSQYLSVFEPH